jgi:hypothetical protein
MRESATYRQTQTEGSNPMTSVTTWVSRLSVVTAYVAFAFVGAIVLGLL